MILYDKYNSSQALYEFTEYMITRYPEYNSFEKEKYVEIEEKYLIKLKYVKKSLSENNDSNGFLHKRINYFRKMFFNQ